MRGLRLARLAADDRGHNHAMTRAVRPRGRYGIVVLIVPLMVAVSFVSPSSASVARARQVTDLGGVSFETPAKWTVKDVSSDEEFQVLLGPASVVTSFLNGSDTSLKKLFESGKPAAVLLVSRPLAAELQLGPFSAATFGKLAEWHGTDDFVTDDIVPQCSNRRGVSSFDRNGLSGFVTRWDCARGGTRFMWLGAMPDSGSFVLSMFFMLPRRGADALQKQLTRSLRVDESLLSTTSG
jgi:hypothetical protein